ncbi:hypothetical protein PVAP13_5KG694150 [Panicum virgatum]|uniref:Uncharacterized protein n=1 Tax=Panicum virgatum TaxID=38727 RepID=A0A8T0T003_PANVG|nr:hypothetical protein PVAP13_5KG694150 [Panicum virgatum]
MPLRSSSVHECRRLHGWRDADMRGYLGACGSGISGGGERSWCPFTTTAEPETAGRT